jgi:hypothetical protein
VGHEEEDAWRRKKYKKNEADTEDRKVDCALSVCLSLSLFLSLSLSLSLSFSLSLSVIFIGDQTHLIHATDTRACNTHRGDQVNRRNIEEKQGIWVMETRLAEEDKTTLLFGMIAAFCRIPQQQQRKRYPVYQFGFHGVKDSRGGCCRPQPSLSARAAGGRGGPGGACVTILPLRPAVGADGRGVPARSPVAGPGVAASLAASLELSAADCAAVAAASLAAVAAAETRV